MVEVCEDVEVDDEENGQEEEEEAVEEPEQVAESVKPLGTDKTEESSGSKEEMEETASGATELPEILLPEMSAEGSGDMSGSESVILLI